MKTIEHPEEIVTSKDYLPVETEEDGHNASPTPNFAYQPSDQEGTPQKDGRPEEPVTGDSPAVDPKKDEEAHETTSAQAVARQF